MRQYPASLSSVDSGTFGLSNPNSSAVVLTEPRPNSRSAAVGEVNGPAGNGDCGGGTELREVGGRAALHVHSVLLECRGRFSHVERQYHTT